jgi:hypothetical protein
MGGKERETVSTCEVGWWLRGMFSIYSRSLEWETEVLRGGGNGRVSANITASGRGCSEADGGNLSLPYVHCHLSTCALFRCT